VTSKYPILNDILRLNEILSGGHHRLLLRRFRPFVTTNALEHVGQLSISHPPCIYSAQGSVITTLESNGKLVVWNYETQIVLSWDTDLSVEVTGDTLLVDVRRRCQILRRFLYFSLPLLVRSTSTRTAYLLLWIQSSISGLFQIWRILHKMDSNRLRLLLEILSK